MSIYISTQKCNLRKHIWSCESIQYCVGFMYSSHFRRRQTEQQQHTKHDSRMYIRKKCLKSMSIYKWFLVMNLHHHLVKEAQWWKRMTMVRAQTIEKQLIRRRQYAMIALHQQRNVQLKRATKVQCNTIFKSSYCAWCDVYYGETSIFRRWTWLFRISTMMFWKVVTLRCLKLLEMLRQLSTSANRWKLARRWRRLGFAAMVSIEHLLHKSSS